MRDFVADMQAARDHASYRRHRGLHTGAVAPGWNWVRPDPAKGSWAATLGAAKAILSEATGCAIEDYRRAVFPERYGDETLDDVVTARIAAECDAMAATF